MTNKSVDELAKISNDVVTFLRPYNLLAGEAMAICLALAKAIEDELKDKRLPDDRN